MNGDGPAEALTVLLATDLGPADVAELGSDVCALALASGGVTAHAAIVARSLGLPLVVGLGEEILAARPGEVVVVDGGEGSAVLAPEPERLERVRADARRRDAARDRSIAERALPAVTEDGHRVAVLANVVSRPEVDVALRDGAEGAGLIRTELSFLDAVAWPSEEDHRAALEPVLRGLRGVPATVRVLDFGGDKTPPFLRGTPERGLRLLLEHPEALQAQLRAVLDLGRECDLRVMLPMVDGPLELMAARDALRDAAAAVPGSPWPLLGAMIETPGAVAAASQLALRADFLSIGTNDLTHSTLGSDRFAPGDARPYHPIVLGHIGRVTRAARDAGIVLEVCGEAASDPVCLPLLVGLGVDELSVGAARVGSTRSWVRALRMVEARELAARALGAADAAEVAALMAPLARALELLERGDAAAERVEGGAGVGAVRP